MLEVSKKKCKCENALLIFREEDTKVHAYLLNKHELKSSKIAYLKNINGTFFMYYEEEFPEASKIQTSVTNRR